MRCLVSSFHHRLKTAVPSGIATPLVSLLGCWPCRTADLPTRVSSPPSLQTCVGVRCAMPLQSLHGACCFPSPALSCMHSRFPTRDVCCSVIRRGKIGLILFFFFRDIHSISRFLYTYSTLYKMAHFHNLEGFPAIFFSLILKMNGDTCFFFPQYWQHYLRVSVTAVLYALAAYAFVN